MSKLSPEMIAAFLGQTPLLSSCELNELMEVCVGAENQQFAAGTAILPAGKPVLALGFLRAGQASLATVDAAAGTQRAVGRISPGESFGEIGLMLDGPSPLAVVAADTCDVVLINKLLLMKLFRTRADVVSKIAKRIARQFVQLSMLGAMNKAPVPVITPTPSNAGGGLAEGQIPFLETSAFTITDEIVGLMPPDLYRKHRMLPLEKRGGKLLIGMVNPRSVEAKRDAKQFLHSLDPEFVAISQDDFNEAFIRLRLDSTGGGRGAQRMFKPGTRLTYAVEVREDAKKKAQLAAGHETIEILDKIIMEGIERGASDIHIEPAANTVLVRYRINGEMVERKGMLSASYATPLLSRIKVVAELDITEHRLPQDGRILAQAGSKELNLRVSTMATARGEKAVIRVIDASNIMRPLNQIFQHNVASKAVEEVLAAPYGAIVIAGPTGSGKSSTLYSMLNDRRKSRPDSNVVTVEDPVEFMLPGVTQVSINERQGLGFSQVLRGLMRQDPDVLVIGELRDSETSAIMVEAALTGHLVLTSTHGNNAASTIQRLQHLGSDPVLLSQALAMIVVQRLARRLCPACVRESEVSKLQFDNLVSRQIVAPQASRMLAHAVGCDGCGGTGYLGRVGVHELLLMDDDIRNALAVGRSPAELINLARKRKKFMSFANSCAYLMARRMLSANDAMLVVAG